MGLLNRFEKFLRDNYPGKSQTIKVTTVRILRDFTIVLNDFVRENPSMTLEQILQNSNFHNRLILQDWKGKEIGGAGSIISKIPDKFDEDLYSLLFNIVWSMVRFELSYDPTIGTEKDMATVFLIVKSYKDQNGFTLQERQEWEQLLKEERVTLYQKKMEERRGGKCIEGDCKNGQGTMGYSDRRRYVGEFKDGKVYGQGTLTFPNGDKYVGKFKDGKFIRR